jgi:thiol:disulfide interchange protein DsbA
MKLFRIALLLMAGLFVSLPAVAQEELFLEGADYQVLDRPLPRLSNSEDGVEVVELFWYGCPHCYRLEPTLDWWLANDKPADAVFIRMPALLNPQWTIHAQAYYTAESLGVLDQTHDAMMKAIHEGKQRLDDEASLAKFFAEHGVARADFERAFKSFQVHTEMNRARKYVQQSGARSVPTILVAGKYLTSATLAGSPEELLRVIDYLVQKEAGAAS